MTTIDDRHRENSQQNDGDPMTTFTAGDMSCQRNAEPTALHNVADTQRLRAAAEQALRILERTGLPRPRPLSYAQPSSHGRAKRRKPTERLISARAFR